MSRPAVVGIAVAAFIVGGLIAALAYQVGFGYPGAGHAVVPVSESLPEGTRYYFGPHRGWGFGFPFYGILFPILFFILLFALIRGALGPRWGDGGPGMDRRTMFEEWHQKLHAEAGERRSDTGTSQRTA